MLRVIYKTSQLDFSLISQIYESSGLEGSSTRYASGRTERHELQIRNELYDCFAELFRLGGFCGLWVVEERIVSVVRIESFKDGYLVAGLATHFDFQRCGYATKLLSAVLDRIGGTCYSHVDKRNEASLSVHMRCGFEKLKDSARYLDGTVTTALI